jgi:hypothetical protein
LAGNSHLDHLNDPDDWVRRSGPPEDVTASSSRKTVSHRFIIENLGFWAELIVLGSVALNIG